jgi:hypothetical protein
MRNWWGENGLSGPRAFKRAEPDRVVSQRLPRPCDKVWFGVGGKLGEWPSGAQQVWNKRGAGTQTPTQQSGSAPKNRKDPLANAQNARQRPEDLVAEELAKRVNRRSGWTKTN